MRAQANGNIEEAFRIWLQIIAIPGVSKKYSNPVRNRIWELCPQMLSLRLKQAREASLQGHWQDEIRLWKDLLALEPKAKDLASLLKVPLSLGNPTSDITESIQERLRIAQQNEQSAWMYKGVQRLIHNEDNATAYTQLKNLWSDAPYYGDPLGLSKALGLPAALNYEQTIAAKQVLLKQERKRQEQERLVRERQERERKEQVVAKQKHLNRIATITMVGPVVGPVVGAVVGVGAVTGVSVGVVGVIVAAVMGAGVGAIAGVIVVAVIGAVGLLVEKIRENS